MVILFAQPNGITYRLLSVRLMVGVGLVSYSAYLWHQPLFAFARSAISNELSLPIMVLISISSIALAFFTWQFVEKPFRDPKKTSRKVIFYFSGIGIVFWVVAGMIGNATADYSGRFGAEINKGDIGHLPYHEYVSRNFHDCKPKHIADEALKWEEFTRCSQSKPDANIDIVLIGDSHSEHLFLGLAEELKDQNVAFYIKNSQPLLNNPEFTNIFNLIISSTSIRTVILSMAWADRLDQPGQNSHFINGLIATIQAITNSGKRLYITDDIPRFPFGPVGCKWSRNWLQDTNCKMPIDKITDQENVFQDVSQKVLAALPDTKVMSLQKHLCNKDYCSMARDGQIIYRDDNHLNIFGSKFIAKKIIEENPEL